MPTDECSAYRQRCKDNKNPRDCVKDVPHCVMDKSNFAKGVEKCLARRSGVYFDCPVGDDECLFAFFHGTKFEVCMMELERHDLHFFDDETAGGQENRDKPYEAGADNENKVGSEPGDTDGHGSQGSPGHQGAADEESPSSPAAEGADGKEPGETRNATGAHDNGPEEKRIFVGPRNNATGNGPSPTNVDDLLSDSETAELALEVLEQAERKWGEVLKKDRENYKAHALGTDGTSGAQGNGTSDVEKEREALAFEQDFNTLWEMYLNQADKDIKLDLRDKVDRPAGTYDTDA